ncbi:hypothetical protein NBRC10512_002098 [Rhodotorula toruloides]|uniref:RHTO0S11e03070g1_1 n=2 Tax=Rhodotorula toruloides TaxID=5286 RepID=A0A061B6X4_RHOTO|nr:histidine acid phosphatase [Rhodotorula toruloides NP11]EMS21669.1 histidine acid phosphatase [Rhodotorula toruloides NP11]CDR45659.1 RHTO0S11e03070g1_1 [Rhodotorula toruloides]
MPNTNAPIGVVILARHGDRAGFYQNPTSYSASDTAVTPLGEQQLFQVGSLVRNIYAGSDPTRAISGLSNTTFDGFKINSTADAGGEGSVIYDSALAFWQGFYPPRTDISNITLANGTVVTSPLGGYQYVQVNTVMPDDDIDFEPWTNCAVWPNRTTELYASPEWTARADQDKDLLDLIKSSGLVGNRTVTMANAYNVWDYMNVNSIHNATYAAELNATGQDVLARAHDLANFHEYRLFTDSTPGGLGNIPGRAILSRIIASMQQFTATGNQVVISHMHASYKPFLSIFNMTQVAAATNPSLPNPYGMVDYASAAVFEVRPGGSGASGHDVRFGFRNGSSTDSDFTYIPLFGSNDVDVDLNTFASNLDPYIIPNNTAWCTLCSNNGSVPACSEWALTQQYETLATKYEKIADGHFTSVGSGFIGAAVTIFVGLAVLGLMRALGFVSFGKRSKQNYGDRYPLTDQQSYKGSVANSQL